MKKLFTSLVYVFLYIGIIFVTTIPAVSAPIPLDSSLTLNAYAKLGDTEASDTYFYSQMGNINALSGSVMAAVELGEPYPDVYSSLSVDALWSDVSSGTVDFDGEVYFDNFPDGPGALGDFYTAGPSLWSYKFIPDTDGQFTLYWDTYDIITNWKTGIVVGSMIPGFRYLIDGKVYMLNSLDPNPIVFDIYSNVPIEISLGWYTSDPSIAGGPSMGGIGPLKMEVGGSFSWSFDTADAPTPVPEPATMMLLGTGIAGLAGFRRKFKKKLPIAKQMKNAGLI